MYKRTLDLTKLVQQKSLFLFGPRQVGKTTLLKTQFPDAKFYNLNASDTFRELNARPESIRYALKPQDKIVIIDEIQKLPSLLDEVQLMIDNNKDLRFILTGSSARKLKRGAANLLAGRAWLCRLFPLISDEVGTASFLTRLNVGGLPSVLNSTNPNEELKAYIGSYLHEEIRAEGLTRSLEAFSRFLEVAGTTNGTELNFTSVGNDADVPPRTVREYFQILEDTLLGYKLEPYRKTIKRKPVATAKFYFFDLGVTNALMRREPFVEQSKSYGDALEHQVFIELLAYKEYTRKSEEICYWRTQSKIEVDFVIGDSLAIEVKSTARIAKKHLKGLSALGEELKLKRKLVVCNVSEQQRLEDGTELVPVQDFLTQLWAGQIF